MPLGKIELIVGLILVIVLLFVGAKKLPELARGVGQSAKELKKGFRDGLPDDEKAAKPTDEKIVKK